MCLCVSLCLFASEFGYQFVCWCVFVECVCVLWVCVLCVISLFVCLFVCVSVLLLVCFCVCLCIFLELSELGFECLVCLRRVCLFDRA